MNVASHNAYAAGQEAFEQNQARIVPISIIHNVEAAKHWYRGWDQANLAAPVHVDVVENSQDIETLDELIAHLEVIRREAGKNLPLSVSVLQETPNNPYGTYYEDRKISNYISVQRVDGVEFVELCI